MNFRRLAERSEGIERPGSNKLGIKLRFGDIGRRRRKREEGIGISVAIGSHHRVVERQASESQVERWRPVRMIKPGEVDLKCAIERRGRCADNEQQQRSG